MTMFTTFKKEMIWGGKKLSIETGKIARQADGAVIVSYGGSCRCVCQQKYTGYF